VTNGSDLIAEQREALGQLLEDLRGRWTVAEHPACTDLR